MSIEDTGNAAEVPAATDDLRSSLETAWTAAEAEAPAEVAAAPEPAQAETAESRARDEKSGRFVPKDKAAEAAPVVDKTAQAAPVEKVLSDQDKQAEQPVAASTPQIGPPVSWSADAKATWANLPPAVQQAAIKREQEASEGIRQWSEKARQYEPYAKAVEPHLQVFQKYGLHPADGIQRLVNAQEYLSRDPENAIMWLARDRGVDLQSLVARLANGQIQPPPRQPVHQQPQHQPQVDFAALARDAVQGQILEQQIAEFSNANPYYADVEREILLLAPAVREENPSLPPMEILKEAYSRAVRANPVAYGKFTAEQDAARNNKTAADQKAAVARSKGAAVSLRGAPGPGQTVNTPQSKGSVRDDLMAAFGAS